MCTSSGKQYSHLDPVSSSHVRFCLTTAYVWRWEKLCTRYKNVIQPWLNLCDHIKMSQLLLMILSGITRVHVIFRNVHDPHSTKWQVHCQVSFPGRSRSTPVAPTAGKTNTHWGEILGSLAGRPTLLWKQTLKGEKGILWIVAEIIVIEERISGHFQILQTHHWKQTPEKKRFLFLFLWSSFYLI